MTPATRRSVAEPDELEGRIAAQLSRLDAEPIPAEPPIELPLLTGLRGRLSTEGTFADVRVLFIQHHLGPFIARVLAMVEDGLAPESCWFVDIPYSTHDLVAQLIQFDLGCPPQQTTEPLSDPLAPYARAQAGRVGAMLQDLARQPGPLGLVVVDDGAYFVRGLGRLAAEDAHLAARFRGTAVVEQTTRGHRYLQECCGDLIDAFELRVVSIARCKTKRLFESPFIGAAVRRAVLRQLEDRPDALERLEHLAILGFGPVGEAVALALAQRLPACTIAVVDPDTDKHPAIRERGWRALTMLPNEPGDHDGLDMVLGCTGYNSFKLHQRRLLNDRALLVSASSASVEFNRSGFIELAARLPDDEIEVIDPDDTRRQGIRAEVRLRHEGGKELSFLHAGFPVNFDGRLECVPTRIIQATHCLLYAATHQCMQSRWPGMVTLDPDLDQWILERAVEALES